MDKLASYPYRQGYTKAIIDIRNSISNSFLDDLKKHGMKFNQKTMIKYLDCYLEHRIELNDNPYSFIRCTKEKEFEYFCPTNK